MEAQHKLFVQLKHGLAPGKHNKRSSCSRPREEAIDNLSQRPGRFVTAAIWAVCSDKVCIAYLAGRLLTIFFFPGPQITAGKSAEYGGTTGICPFPLKTVEDFFNDI